MILVDHFKRIAVISKDGSSGSLSANCCDPALLLLHAGPFVWIACGNQGAFLVVTKQDHYPGERLLRIHWSTRTQIEQPLGFYLAAGIKMLIMSKPFSSDNAMSSLNSLKISIHVISG